MAFFLKDRQQILDNILQQLELTTQISATSPGSVARGLVEAVSTEIADLYSVMDLNLSISVLSTAQGSTLDLLGSLYDVRRKTLSNLAAVDASVGAFYFYMDGANPSQFMIPKGTKITTDSNDLLGKTFTYTVVDDTIFPAGRTRVFATIRPAFADSIFTAGVNTLTFTDFIPPPGIILKCTNPKAIPAQPGFESDEAYRTRLLNAIRTAAGGTELSCRMTALSVPGVRDVKIRTAAFGLGCFEVLVVLEDASAATITTIAVQDALDRVRPVGVRLFLREPDPIYLDLTASIVIQQNTGINTEMIARRAEIAVVRYLNELSVGTPLVYNQLIQAIMDSTPEAVLDVVVSSLLVNGSQILRKNYAPLATEQILPGFISVAVA